MDPTPRSAPWMRAAGIRDPEPNEDFVSYWLAAGVDQETIDLALHGLVGARTDVANDRLISWVGTQIPDAFTAWWQKEWERIQNADRPH